MRKEEHFPIEETIPGRAALWFRINPDTFITNDSIARFTGLGNVYEQSNIESLISGVRRILRDSPDVTGHVVNIHCEHGYAYYPQIAAGDHIGPVGYRPIPQWEGDATRIVQLQKLFTDIRGAVVKPDLKQAQPLLQNIPYRYLTLLARAYVKGPDYTVEELQLDPLIIYPDLIRVHRFNLKASLEELTKGKWRIEHEKAPNGGWEGGKNYLIYCPAALSEPVAASSPPSLSAT